MDLERPLHLRREEEIDQSKEWRSRCVCTRFWRISDYKGRERRGPGETSSSLKSWLQKRIGNFISEDLMEGSSGINIKIIPDRRVYLLEGFLFRAFWPTFQRIFLPSGLKGSCFLHWSFEPWRRSENLFHPY